MNALAARQPALALRIRVCGAVQGVGFRPFVYRLARQCRLAGNVRNAADGVTIIVEGPAARIARFRNRLTTEAPPHARLDRVTAESIPPTGLADFAIEASVAPARPTVRVTADLALCPQCSREILDEHDRRYGYPFTNCTACGPRYSIIEAMPYDRAATAMKHFAMCPACAHEHQAPTDRRFHAQPSACRACGPRAQLWDHDGTMVAGADEAVSNAVELLRRGKIVALKGVGGFQLLVRADDAAAVTRLRQLKHRPSKPLAVMVLSLEVAQTLAVLGSTERRLLQSAQNPIVLAKKRTGSSPPLLAAGVAPHVDTLGLLLPTTPLHHLILNGLNAPVVATSGNRSEEPIVTHEREALKRLAGIADFFLVHDRPIVRRVDDSVVRVIGGKTAVLRLARGYAPWPLPSLARHAGSTPILAVGGHQKSALALFSGAQAVLGQHIGDLDERESRDAFSEAVRDWQDLYQCEPEVIACDLHPDYFTTQWAQAQRKPMVQVQHHHAHAVSCMVEHGLLDREVLAVVWDGTGYGVDGVVWGGEILRVTVTGFQRVASLLPFPLPGGAAAIRHPGRTAFGLLWVALGAEKIVPNGALLGRLGLTPREASVMDAMIRKNLNTPWTSSVGRLFDAIAALVLGINEASYEGEPAVWLEAAVHAHECESYALPLLPSAQCHASAGDRFIPRGDWRPMLTSLLDDLAKDVEPGVIAARFHNALAEWARAVAAEHAHADIVLSGGCFQNAVLTERTMTALGAGSRRVYTHGDIPAGDGGLAVGQLAVALARCRAPHT